MQRPAATARIREIFDRLRAEIEQAALAGADWHRTNLHRHRDRYVADLEVIVSLAPPGTEVLEVGAAPGHFAVALARAGYAVRAVDVDPRRIADFSRRFGIEIVACDIEVEPLPFADGRFPYVVCAETYEHLRRDPFFALSEINRVMVAGGTLLLTTPNLYSAQNIARFLSGRSIADPLGEFGKLRTIGHMGHVREYSNREMRRILGAHGFEVVATHFDHYYYPSTRRGRVARVAFTMLPRRYRTFQRILARKRRPGPGLRPLPAPRAT